MAVELFGFKIGRKEDPPNKNLQVFAQPEYDDGALPVSSGGVFGTYVDTEGAVKSEIELVNRYRDMALQSEVENAIDDIVNESIVYDPDSHTAEINLDAVQVSDSIKSKISFSNNKMMMQMQQTNDIPHVFY